MQISNFHSPYTNAEYEPLLLWWTLWFAFLILLLSALVNFVVGIWAATLGSDELCSPGFSSCTARIQSRAFSSYVLSSFRFLRLEQDRIGTCRGAGAGALWRCDGAATRGTRTSSGKYYRLKENVKEKGLTVKSEIVISKSTWKWRIRGAILSLRFQSVSKFLFTNSQLISL